MAKELLQHTWWASVRGSWVPPGGPQGSTAPQFGKHCSRVTPLTPVHYSRVTPTPVHYSRATPLTPVCYSRVTLTPVHYSRVTPTPVHYSRVIPHTRV